MLNSYRLVKPRTFLPFLILFYLQWQRNACCCVWHWRCNIPEDFILQQLTLANYWFHETLSPYTRGTQIFQKYGCHFKSLGPRTVTWSSFHADDPQIFGATVQTLVARDFRTSVFQLFCLFMFCLRSQSHASGMPTHLTFTKHEIQNQPLRNIFFQCFMTGLQHCQVYMPNVAYTRLVHFSAYDFNYFYLLQSIYTVFMGFCKGLGLLPCFYFSILIFLGLC